MYTKKTVFSLIIFFNINSRLIFVFLWLIYSSIVMMNLFFIILMLLSRKKCIFVALESKLESE